MKKLLVLVGILAAFSFVACDKEADPVNPPASDPIENPTDTPDVPDTGMGVAQTIYFMGLILLLSGVGIVYANAKPKTNE